MELREAWSEAAGWLRDYLAAIAAGRVHAFSYVERRARAATRDEPSGPTSGQLHFLADASGVEQNAHVIIAVLGSRLAAPPGRWRSAYKALLCLEFLLRRGDARAVPLARRALGGAVGFLARNFDQSGVLQGEVTATVRARAASVSALLGDDARLRAERSAAAALPAYDGYTRRVRGRGGEGCGAAQRTPCIGGATTS